jgi:predicted MFS family arabinose efflux permease
MTDERRPRPTPTDDPNAARLGAGISRGTVLMLALVTGAAAANLYYAQPLLDTLESAFSTSTATTGLVVTIAQVGYLLALTFVVPLGDLLERRALITAAMCMTALAMVACGLAPSFAVFAVATWFVGVSVVAAQIIVPMASALARPEERGRVVGTVMSGLLIGVLLARTFSGLVAAAVGWRVVYFAAAALMLGLAVTLRRTLPRVPPTTSVGYGRLLRSVGSLIAAEPVLRRRMLLGALSFGCFSTLWTSLAFLLAAAPFHYGSAVIGLFGLAGVAGAGAATVVGRMADRGRGALATSVSVAILLGSWAVLYLGHADVVALIVGIIGLDLGVQGVHISNQSAIYALDPEARSRLTTAYMVAYFTGGAVFSVISSAAFESHGWAGVCVVGAIPAAVVVAVWALGRPRPSTARATAGLSS